VCRPATHDKDVVIVDRRPAKDFEATVAFAEAFLYAAAAMLLLCRIARHAWDRKPERKSSVRDPAGPERLAEAGSAEIGPGSDLAGWWRTDGVRIGDRPSSVAQLPQRGEVRRAAAAGRRPTGRTAEAPLAADAKALDRSLLYVF
jgi:hypothetical protein